MYKNQLQELAQRSCFNLPSYACVREGPDHAPRFKATVNFNGEIFQGPSHCTTLRQAEHAAAEVALTNLSSRAPSRSIAARVLVSLSSPFISKKCLFYSLSDPKLSPCKDETGVYKNLLQETTHRAGLKLPVYTTVRSGPGHQPVFTSTVELAGMCIAGEPAKTKKQAEKNAAMAAWSSLKQMPDLESLARPSEGGGCCGGGEEQEQVVRYLYNLKPKEENKQARQREHYCPQPQQKQKRKLVGFNDGTSPATSPHRSLRFHQQWRSLEPLADLPLIHPSQQQQKNCSFLAPAHSTGPKVMSPLLFTLNSSVSSQEPFSSKGTINSSLFHPPSRPLSPIVGSSSSQLRSQEIKTLSDGKKAEQLHDKTIQGQSSSSSARSHPFVDPNSSVFAARAFSPPQRPNIPIAAAPLRNSTSIPVPRMMNTGGFPTHGIAPAVQIRSVIPVCAAPPIRQQQQPPVTNVLPASIPNKETEDDTSAAISELNKLHL